MVFFNFNACLGAHKQFLGGMKDLKQQREEKVQIRGWGLVPRDDGAKAVIGRVGLVTLSC